MKDTKKQMKKKKSHSENSYDPYVDYNKIQDEFGKIEGQNDSKSKPEDLGDMEKDRQE